MGNEDTPRVQLRGCTHHQASNGHSSDDNLMEDSVGVSDKDDDLPIIASTLRTKGVCNSVRSATKLEEGDFGNDLVVRIYPHWQSRVVLHVEVYQVGEEQ